MEQEILQIKESIKNLNDRLDKFYSSTTIPFDVQGAFTTRLKIPQSQPSSISVASKTQAVNEAGSATYNVAKPMSAIIRVKIGDNIYNLADYS